VLQQRVVVWRSDLVMMAAEASKEWGVLQCVQSVAVCCSSVWRCVAVCCSSVLQCVAVCCSVCSIYQH